MRFLYHKYHKVFSILLFLFCIESFGHTDFVVSQETVPLTLPQALQTALTRHVDVIIAHERVEQTLARIKEKSSPLLPHLGVTASFNRQTRDLRSSGIPISGDPLVGPFNVYDARIRLTQTIFDPAALTRFSSSRQGHILSLAQQKKVREDTLVLVATLFIEAKRTQDALAVYQAALRRDKKELGIVFSRLKSGMSSSLDLKKARSQYAQALYQFETAKKESIQRRLDLAAAIDIPQEQKWYCVWDEALFVKVIHQEFLLDHHPDIKVARESLKLEEKDRNAARWDLWPKVAISGDYGPSGEGIQTRESSETYGLGVSASIPIFEGGSRQARIKESQSTVRESQEELKSVERMVRAQYATQLASVAQAEALVKEKIEQLAVAQEEQSLIRTKFNSGNASSLDLASADVNLKVAIDQKEEAQAYFLLAKINLARSLGNVEKFLLE